MESRIPSRAIPKAFLGRRGAARGGSTSAGGREGRSGLPAVTKTAALVYVIVCVCVALYFGRVANGADHDKLPVPKVMNKPNFSLSTRDVGSAASRKDARGDDLPPEPEVMNQSKWIISTRDANGAVSREGTRGNDLLPVHGQAPKRPGLRAAPEKCEATSRGHFDSIYRQGGWGRRQKAARDFYGNAQWPPQKARLKSASGPGSDLGYATHNSLQIVRRTISKYNLSTMLDVPCGDVNWILDSFETDTVNLYVGLDITRDVVDANNARFAHHNNKHFYVWDATECVIPEVLGGTSGARPFDLVHVRDVIQHLPLQMGVKYFCNIFKSGPRYLITTTYPNASENRDIAEGKWYRNNLSLEPFSFPPGDDCIRTHPKMEPDVTCVFDLSRPWVKTFISTKC